MFLLSLRDLGDELGLVVLLGATRRPAAGLSTAGASPSREGALHGHVLPNFPKHHVYVPALSGLGLTTPAGGHPTRGPQNHRRYLYV